MSGDPHSPRRPWQYSLRSLMLVVTLACVAAALVRWLGPAEVATAAARVLVWLVAAAIVLLLATPLLGGWFHGAVCWWGQYRAWRAWQREVRSLPFETQTAAAPETPPQAEEADLQAEEADSPPGVAPREGDSVESRVRGTPPRDAPADPR